MAQSGGLCDLGSIVVSELPASLQMSLALATKHWAAKNGLPEFEEQMELAIARGRAMMSARQMSQVVQDWT